MANHGTPWKVVNSVADAAFIIEDSHRDTICVIRILPDVPDSNLIARTRAETIVRAVNTLSPLLLALERSSAMLEACGTGMRPLKSHIATRIEENRIIAARAIGAIKEG